MQTQCNPDAFVDPKLRKNLYGTGKPDTVFHLAGPNLVPGLR